MKTCDGEYMRYYVCKLLAMVSGTQKTLKFSGARTHHWGPTLTFSVRSWGHLKSSGQAKRRQTRPWGRQHAPGPHPERAWLGWAGLLQVLGGTGKKEMRR